MSSNPPSRPTKKRKLEWENFSLPDINVMLRRRKGPRTENVPEIDPAYVFREELVREIAWSAWPPNGYRPLPVLFTGPKGCGKTTIIEQVAAHCNIPVFRINLNVGTSVRHLKGHRGAVPGKTVFHRGVATRAMEAPVAWLILDELSGATPPVALSLFPILEHSGAVLLEDAEPPRYVRRSPFFRVFATDNTIGAGQEATRFNYGGTNPEVNEALLDRFGSFTEVGYLDPEKEHEAVKALVPQLNDMMLESMIRTFGMLRLSTIDFSFSTRMLINWGQRLAASPVDTTGHSRPVELHDSAMVVHHARQAFLNSMRSTLDRDAALEIIRRVHAESPQAPGSP